MQIADASTGQIVATGPEVRLLNKVGSAALVLLRQCGPARPDAQWKLVVGRQFSMWLQISLDIRNDDRNSMFLPARAADAGPHPGAGINALPSS
jgi:hypothetical protein